MRHAGPIRRPVGYGSGDHLCWFYEHDGAWREAASAYLDDGGAADALVYVGDGDEAELAAQLAALPGRDAMRESGQLRLLPLPQADRSLNVAGTAAGADALVAEARQATASGYRGLRLAADVSPLVATADAAHRFAAYELLVDGVVANGPMSALCGYDRRRVSATTTSLLSFVHPLRHGAHDGPLGGLHANSDGSWRIRGEIDLASSAGLHYGLAGLPHDRDAHFDLGDLDFIDVGGTRAMVALSRRLAPGHRVVLHRAPDHLRRLLELCWPDAGGLEVAGR